MKIESQIDNILNLCADLRAYIDSDVYKIKMTRDILRLSIRIETFKELVDKLKVEFETIDNPKGVCFVFKKDGVIYSAYKSY